ncbi:acyltransferase [Chryseolinea sp. H1M3-3]|uniref:acyltransferase n=1 Tax=Chryseolinea sp. H1M3-3 TaxID=3034144 RepID=UPI0023EC67DB|nr:acyltransferase [Chryseolinea sp. H1M3-3]
MKKNLYTRLTEDNGSWWIHKIDNFTMSCYQLYSTTLMRIISFFRGVSIDVGCRFFGLTHFRRFPSSTIHVGKDCVFRSDQTSNLIGVNHPCILSTHFEKSEIRIGDHCGFSGVTIGAAREIRIGNNVLCGANCVITDFDWHLDLRNTPPAPVIIHDNVWIGLNTVILKGVEIGANSVIGANSLVVHNIPSNVIAAGNPCKVIKAR